MVQRARKRKSKLKNNIMKNEIKIVDGFIWAIIEPEEAKQKLKSCDSIFRLHKDDTETLVEDENELNDTITENDKIGVEIGKESVLFDEFGEGEQNRFRNNDKRGFFEWLDDKINVILE